MRRRAREGGALLLALLLPHPRLLLLRCPPPLPLLQRRRAPCGLERCLFTCACWLVLVHWAAGAQGQGADCAAEAGDQQPDQAAGAGAGGEGARDGGAKDLALAAAAWRGWHAACTAPCGSSPASPAASPTTSATRCRRHLWPKQGAAVGLAEEADLEELIRQKEALVAERDGQVQAIVALRGEVRRRGRGGRCGARECAG